MNRLNELIKNLCPDGVPYRTLGEIGTFYSGLSGKTKEDFKEGNATFITYMNVYSNMELQTNVTEKVRIGENEKQNIVQYGDVIFTGSSETLDECGMSSVVTSKTDEKLYLNSFCFGYRFNKSSYFIPAFTKHLFRSNELRRQIIRTASGVTRFNVSKKRWRMLGSLYLLWRYNAKLSACWTISRSLQPSLQPSLQLGESSMSIIA